MHVRQPRNLVAAVDKFIDLAEVSLEIVIVGWCARGYRPLGFVFLKHPEKSNERELSFWNAGRPLRFDGAGEDSTAQKAAKLRDRSLRHRRITERTGGDWPIRPPLLTSTKGLRVFLFRTSINSAKFMRGHSRVQCPAAMFGVRDHHHFEGSEKLGSMSNEVDRRWPERSSRAGVHAAPSNTRKGSTGMRKRSAGNAQA